MSNEKRYSVWGTQDQASRWSPDHINWNDANRALQAVGADWRIWDHSTNPPTDVTDADPEAEAEEGQGMSNEKRYSVFELQQSAVNWGPRYTTWSEARKEEWKRIERGNDRIWDHSTNPPTDVTDADPEAVKVEVEVTTVGTKAVRYVSFDTGDDPGWGGAIEVVYEQQCTNHVDESKPYYRVTVERIEPEPEQPQWWEWVQHAVGDPIPGHWEEYYDQNRKYTSAIAQGAVNDIRCIVYGTAADRDAKRDALLAAARAAGKGGEG